MDGIGCRLGRLRNIRTPRSVDSADGRSGFLSFVVFVGNDRAEAVHLVVGSAEHATFLKLRFCL